MSHVTGDKKSDLMANEGTTYSLLLKLITTSKAFNNIKNKIIETWQYNWTNTNLADKRRNVKPDVKKS